MQFQNILYWSLSTDGDSGSMVIVLISKHLMLKFIGRKIFSPVRSRNFKTSYVEVYHCCSLQERHWKGISKHLMLKFIPERSGLLTWSFTFQNILCWSLSTFNTDFSDWLRTFQNILCWSLSKYIVHPRWSLNISKHLMLKFIVNLKFTLMLIFAISKHLMLKFIEEGRTSRRGIPHHFKTSYVEVYPITEDWH